MKDYSQYKEQEAILANTPTMGRFLDIGAYHPTCLSNTRALYERGWSGVMVEPSPEPFLSLLKEYGNDERITLLNVGVGALRGFIPMHATADAVSTTDAKVRETWAQQGGYYGKFQAWHVSCGQIAKFGPFDFVNIDAEGNSGEIFKMLLDGFPIWRDTANDPNYTFKPNGNGPSCICVEHDGKGQELAALAAQFGYRVALLNGCNLVVAR